MIQQSLSPDKMPIAFLLGAGCPLSIRIPPSNSPLIPDIAGLTKHICEELAKIAPSSDHFDLIKAHLTQDGCDKATIEDMLTHIRTLMQAAGKDKARGLTSEQLRMLDEEICKLIDVAVRKRLPNSATPYHKLASWVNAIARKSPIEVFTTNYDLLMEQAFEEQGIPYFDGFVGSDRTFFDPPSMELEDLPPRWSRLWKLHGSINWRQHKTTRVVSRGEIVVKDERRLIHPSHLKYDESRRMPYLAMMDRLRAFMRRSPAVLICCGYSFSDQHINEVLVQGLQGNPSAVSFALMYSDLEAYPHAIACATRRTNLCILARDEAVIGCQRGKWSVPADAVTFASSISVKSDPATGASAEFLLGDFEKFAAFLYEQLGSDTSHPGAKHGS
jgi:hypothetical protein